MSSTVALAAAVSAPQPSASKPASAISVALDAHRDAHKVAARGTAGGAGVGPRLQRAPASGRVQMFGEAFALKAENYRAAIRFGKSGPSLPLSDPSSWACCRSKSGCPPGGPRPYLESDSLPGGIRLNMCGRLANRLGPKSSLAALSGGTDHLHAELVELALVAPAPALR